MNSEKPIIFSTPMVQAILDGRKTQTRRVVKDPRRKSVNPISTIGSGGIYSMGDIGNELRLTKDIKPNFPPPYQVGDRLWVRETWQYGDTVRPRIDAEIIYKADNKWSANWKPSIHMPKKYARIWLEVTGVRVEKLQDIRYLDVEKEGVWIYEDNYKSRNLHFNKAIMKFAQLWDSINGKKYPWSSNPWIFVYEFRRES